MGGVTPSAPDEAGGSATGGRAGTPSKPAAGSGGAAGSKQETQETGGSKAVEDAGSTTLPPERDAGSAPSPMDASSAAPDASSAADAAPAADAAASTDAAVSDAAVGGDAGDAGPAPDAGFMPARDSTYLSDTDRSEHIKLSPDRLSAEWLDLATISVRSTRAIPPRSGVVYFEAFANLDYFQLGVATAAARLDIGAGQTPEGFSVDVGGYAVAPNGDSTMITKSPNGNYGFVVDYRGEHPTIYVIADGKLAHTQTVSTISAPLFIHLSGSRRSEGFQAGINPGNDTVNQPFAFDPKAVLTEADHADVAAALVLGWGATHAGTLNEPPVLKLGANPALTVAVNASLTLSASATDREDGSLDARIAWDVVSTGIGPEHVHADGATFTFTPKVIGKHPIKVTVRDAGGKLAEQALTVEATGTLEQHTSVKLVAEGELSGAGIMLSDDGLRAHWTAPDKMGVRANQGLYKGFWYVEGHRLVDEENQAIGLVIGGVSLNPYHFNITPPSCSVNTVGPSVWQNLIAVHEFTDKDFPLARTEYYGLAVDYRGDYPIVYVILQDEVASVLQLKDVTVPIYPMLYGNPTGFSAAWDMAINFGATPFHEHPAQALQAAGIDPQGLRLCWGAMNTACTQ